MSSAGIEIVADSPFLVYAAAIAIVLASQSNHSGVTLASSLRSSPCSAP
jgi:hypothetical protein